MGLRRFQRSNLKRGIVEILLFLIMRLLRAALQAERATQSGTTHGVLSARDYMDSKGTPGQGLSPQPRPSGRSLL